MSVEKGELKPGGARVVPEDAWGPAGCDLVDGCTFMRVVSS